MAAEKENPLRGFTQNTRGPRTEHAPPNWAHIDLSVAFCRNCKQPKESSQIHSEPSLKEIGEGGQNNRESSHRVNPQLILRDWDSLRAKDIYRVCRL